MRVTHLSTQQLMLDAIGNNQSDIARLQAQIATGKRIFAPADDPFGATRVLELNRALEQLGQYDSNGQLARHRLSLEDETLAQVVSTLQRVSELAVQANNGTETDETRTFIATELEELKTQLVELGNMSDGEGGFLFSGYRHGTRPFADGAGGVSYLGDQGQRMLQIGPSRQVPDSDSGADVFMLIPNGNGNFATFANTANTGTAVLETGSVVDQSLWDQDTYTIEFVTDNDYEVRDSGGALVASGVHDGSEQAISFAGVEVTLAGQAAAGDQFTLEPSASQDLFETVQNFIDALGSPTSTDTDEALLHNRLNNVMTDLDQAFGHLSQTRTRVGTRLNAVDNQAGMNAGQTLLLQATLSSIEDVDLAAAVSELDLKLTTLQAAEQSFVAVQRLSLFNFL